MSLTIFQNTALQSQAPNLLNAVLPAAAAEAALIAAKELKQERIKNEQEIKRAESNLSTLMIPSDLADLGLTRQDLSSELHNVVPGIKAAGSSSSAELRQACISRETLERIAKQKGLSPVADKETTTKAKSDNNPT